MARGATSDAEVQAVLSGLNKVFLASPGGMAIAVDYMTKERELDFWKVPTGTLIQYNVGIISLVSKEVSANKISDQDAEGQVQN